MLRPVRGAVARTRYTSPHPTLILQKRILSFPPLAGHMDCWDEGQPGKGRKNTQHIPTPALI